MHPHRRFLAGRRVCLRKPDASRRESERMFYAKWESDEVVEDEEEEEREHFS
jgi:hypothetical protein